MPDTEVATPAPETPAAEPAAAPAPEEGAKPRVRQTEAQRVAAAAAKLEELQGKNKPGDPTKGAAPPAEPAPEPPAAAAAPAPGTEDERPLSEQEPTNANYRIWRNRTTKLERDTAALKAEKARLESLVPQIQAFEADKKLLREDPKAFWAKVAREHGSDFTKEYEKFANAYIDDGKPEGQVAALQAQLKELTDKLADRDKKADEERRAHAERQVIGNFLRLAVGDQHQNTAYTYRKYGEQTVLQDAAAVAQAFVDQHGRTPSDAEIAAELDIQYGRHYKEIVDSRSGLSQPSQGVTERVNGAEKPAKPVAPQAPKTLTNGGSAERATPPRKLTEKERIEAAIKLLPG